MANAVLDDRLMQVEKTIRTFLTSFGIPIGQDQSREQFVSTFHPDIHWRDHAFLVCRVGHEAVLGLHKSWLHCNQPFDTTLKAIHATKDGAVVEVIWRGRQANDIVRPDGQVAVKASGNQYDCHVCMVLKIDAKGLIETIDEYYNKRWDEGVAEETYGVVRGSSMKL